MARGRSTSSKAPTATPSPAVADERGSVNGAASAAKPMVTAEQAVETLGAYPPQDTSAPEVIDDRLLRVWVSLPEVCKRLSHGLDVAEGLDKFELIEAGITRKQRQWRSESAVAGNLAKLCRRRPVLWSNVARSAIDHYLAGEAGKVLIDELPELAADPLEYYGESEQAPDAIVLFALALDSDEGVLDLIAADCARELGERTVTDKAAAQEQRIQTLEAEAGELRRQAKHADRERRDAVKREREIAAENARLREAVGDASDAQSAADRELRRRAEEAEAQVEKFETERIPELEARLGVLEDASDRLEAVESELHVQRLLRTQAEQDASRLNARVRALTDQLSRASDSGNLPTDDAPALLDALLRPIGQAARHAAERLEGS